MKQLIFILFAISSVYANASDILFDKANKLYAQEKYTDAILLYDSIISSGLESSELYYNLGNCSYKNSDWANAIWHYEKSLQLDKNEKTKQNLELVNLKIIDQIEAPPQLFYKKWWFNLILLLNTKTWQILSVIIICFILLLKTLNQLRYLKKYNFSHLLMPIAMTLFFISMSSYSNTYSKKEAIIFSSSVIVNSAPSNNSTNLFSLHAGTKVEITDAIGEWIYIKIQNGNNGWIQKSDCKTLQ